MYFDSHVHSEASPDSEMNPRVAIEILQGMGLGVAFTEHVDYAKREDGLNPLATDRPNFPGVRDFVCDFSKYPKEYEALRSEGGVTLGLEFGLSAAYEPLNRRLAQEYDYDFILGSMHNVDGFDIYIAGDSGCVRRYLTYAKEMCELNDFFDAFGHIDYICRRSKKLTKEFAYSNFPDEFDALFKVLASRDTALEINTQLFGQDRARHVIQEICRQFARNGGRFCTIGSDAHEPHELGQNFNEAKEVAREAGLRPVYFVKRERVYCE